MKLKHMYLVLGILLSVASKWMQFQYGSLWGVFFLLGVFLFAGLGWWTWRALVKQV